MIRTARGNEADLTKEIVDEAFPLQGPHGIATLIKQKLDEGDTDLAEALYTDLRAADYGQAQQIAEELLVRHELPAMNLDVLRALRLGVQAGIQHGRQEGANVVRELMRPEGE